MAAVSALDLDSLEAVKRGDLLVPVGLTIAKSGMPGLSPPPPHVYAT